MADTDTDPGEERASVAGHSVPTWWTWVTEHRKPVMLVAGLVVAGLVATAVAVTVFASKPADVVRDYMDAIRAGDTQAALEIAGEPDAGDRLTFLSSDALADDWTVDAVVERHLRDDEADVDVTISAGDTAGQGRFHLTRGDDGWTIDAPFVQVDLAAGDLDVVELGGVRRKVTRPADPTSGGVRLLVFPGVYELYPSLADQITFAPATLIATPRKSKDETLRFTTDYTLTKTGAGAARQAINARIDDCATKSDLSPVGCPFNAGLARVTRGLTDLGDVDWTVVTHPEARIVADGTGGFRLIVRKPGTVRLTGSGAPEEPAGAPRATFTATCEFGLESLTVAMTMAGFTSDGDGRDPYQAARETHCF
jgi:hypothetical protein